MDIIVSPLAFLAPPSLFQIGRDRVSRGLPLQRGLAMPIRRSTQPISTTTICPLAPSTRLLVMATAPAVTTTTKTAKEASIATNAGRTTTTIAPTPSSRNDDHSVPDPPAPVHQPVPTHSSVSTSSSRSMHDVVPDYPALLSSYATYGTNSFVSKQNAMHPPSRNDDPVTDYTALVPQTVPTHSSTSTSNYRAMDDTVPDHQALASSHAPRTNSFISHRSSMHPPSKNDDPVLNDPALVHSHNVRDEPLVSPRSGSTSTPERAVLSQRIGKVPSPSTTALGRSSTAGANEPSPVRPLSSAKALAELMAPSGSTTSTPAPPVVVVKLFARSCRACMGASPRFVKSARAFGESLGPHTVTFAEMDYSENKEFCKDYLGVSSLPFFAIFKRGVDNLPELVEGHVLPWNRMSILDKRVEEILTEEHLMPDHS